VNDAPSPAAPVVFDEKVARSLEQSYQTPEVVLQRQRTLTALHLEAGEHALDVGCGPGLLVADMAKQVGPTGHVTGVDKSGDMLALGRDRCRDLPQVSFLDADLKDLPIPDGAFDAAACTQTLLFVPDVAGALAQLHRVLKPGGRIAVLETDWRGVVLNSTDEALTRRLFDAWDELATSPNLPVRLGPLLKRTGFTAVRAEAVPILNTSYTPGNFSVGFVKGLAKKAVENGLATRDETDAWLDGLKQLGRDGAYFFCVNRFLFSGVKV